MGQTRCRAPGGPPAAGEPRAPRRRPFRAGRVRRAQQPPPPRPPAPACPSPGAEGAGRAWVPAWRAATSNRASPPDPGARRGRYPSDAGPPATHRLAPPPTPRRRSPPPAAAALLQPQAPPSSPIYKLGARSWELEMRLSLPSASFSFSLRPSPAPHSALARVARAAAAATMRAASLPPAALLLLLLPLLPPPLPPGRAPSWPRACAGRRGARARARGGAAASGKPGPAPRPRRGGQVEPPSERPQTAPAAPGLTALPAPDGLSPVLAASRARQGLAQTPPPPGLPGRNCRCHSAFTDGRDNPGA